MDSGAWTLDFLKKLPFFLEDVWERRGRGAFTVQLSGDEAQLIWHRKESHAVFLGEGLTDDGQA